MDRESDLYELLQEALRDAQGPWLLIRAEQDRRLAEGQEHLESCVAQQLVAGIQEIQVPRHGAKRARVARLEVRFARVSLQPPKNRKSLGAPTLWAVLAQEVEAPSGIAPVCWILLTTCPVESNRRSAVPCSARPCRQAVRPCQLETYAASCSAAITGRFQKSDL